MLYCLLIFVGFAVGLATGVLATRILTEKKERDFLKRMEVLGYRNNEILDECKQIISYNNKLATKNKELSDQIERFIEEWT